jgi:hypothetical protein
MSVDLVCYIAAAVCFILRALSVNTGRIDCTNLGFFFLVLSLIL